MPLVALVLAVVGFAVQQTAIVPAVHTVEQSLHSSPEWAAWLVTVYLIVATVATPAMGRLADLHGRRRMLLVALAVFVVGSTAAAFAPNMPILIVCRAVQGMGGAVYPLTLAIARAEAPDRASRSVAILTAAFGIGTAIGFAGGGVLADDVSWRWIFGLGAILVLLATGFVAWAVPRRPDRATGSFDPVGTAVLAAAAVGLLMALTLVVPLGPASPATLAMFALSGVASVLWLRLETRRDDPLVDLHVLRDPKVAIANAATIGLGWALFSSYLLIPDFLEQQPGRQQFGLGASPTLVGLLLLPLAVGQTIGSLAGGRLAAPVGTRRLFAAGLGLVALGMGLLAVLSTSVAPVPVLTFVLGLGAGLALETASDVATQGVADDVAAVSSALNSTIRRLAGGIGGQVSTILLAALVVGTANTPSRAGYVAGYLIAAALSLAGVALVLKTAAQDPATPARPARRGR